MCFRSGILLRQSSVLGAAAVSRSRETRHVSSRPPAAHGGRGATINATATSRWIVQSSRGLSPDVGAIVDDPFGVTR
jgi:hypothetical protein